MTLVVDASIAVKWFFEEADHRAAHALLDRGEKLVAPTLVLAEIGNAAWKRHRRGEITRDDADSVARLMTVPFSELVEHEVLLQPAMTFALDLQHPIYDCFYLALAARLSAPLITADSKLATLGARAGIEVETLPTAT